MGIPFLAYLILILSMYQLITLRYFNILECVEQTPLSFSAIDDKKETRKLYAK